MSEKSGLKVVVVDDDDVMRQQWESAIKRAARGSVPLTFNNVPQKSLKAAVEQLEKKRRHSRSEASTELGSDVFDDADIVFVDHDLLDLEGLASLTGEDIAYLLRCFTSCGIIVILNPGDLGTNFFDLNLRRPFDSWADAVMGSDQLANRWLWKDTPVGFAPWCWPSLPDAVRRRRRQVVLAQKDLGRSVGTLVGLTHELLINMDDAMAAAVVDKDGKSFKTLWKFVLSHASGIQRKDNADFFEKNPEQLARIGASRLSSWLDQVVLPAQTVLIDLPHLVSRLPGILSKKRSKAVLESICSREGKGWQAAVKAKELDAFRFRSDDWLSRAAWIWPQVMQAPAFSEWARGETGGVVFCEDTSRFIDAKQARRFRANTPAPANFRYVEKLEGVSYEPSVRLAL